MFNLISLLLKSIKKFILIFYVFGVISFIISCNFTYHSQELADVPESIKVIDTIGYYLIKSEGGKLVFSSKHSKINNPLLYNDNLNDFNFNGFYRITNESGKSGYFRFGWIDYEENTNKLSRLNWFYKDFKVDTTFKEYLIESIQVDIKQNGEIKICTIGDSQTWWSDASILRKYLDQLNPNFYFVGSNTDIYAYPHEGEGGDSTEELLVRIKKIPEADYYTLLIGTNDWQEDLSSSFYNIQEITNYLLQKYSSSKILYLTPLPTSNKKRDKFNTTLKKKVLSFIKNKKRIYVVEIGEKMREENSWKTKYLTSDGLHPSREGVYLMAETITSFINLQNK